MENNRASAWKHWVVVAQDLILKNQEEAEFVFNINLFELIIDYRATKTMEKTKGIHELSESSTDENERYRYFPIMMISHLEEVGKHKLLSLLFLKTPLLLGRVSCKIYFFIFNPNSKMKQNK